MRFNQDKIRLTTNKKYIFIFFIEFKEESFGYILANFMPNVYYFCVNKRFKDIV